MGSVFAKAACGALMLGATIATTLPAKAVADGCAVVLQTHDGFLAVRSRPGIQHPIITRIFPGQIIVTNHVSDAPYAGQWWRIGAIIDGIGQAPRSVDGFGWIHSGFVTPVNC